MKTSYLASRDKRFCVMFYVLFLVKNVKNILKNRIVLLLGLIRGTVLVALLKVQKEEQRTLRFSLLVFDYY